MAADILPDSRLRHQKKGTWRGPWGNWEPIFCANCNGPGGFVPEENMTFAFYLCNDCVEKHGQIAGVMLIPDEVVWEQIAADQEGARQEAIARGIIDPEKGLVLPKTLVE